MPRESIYPQTGDGRIKRWLMETPAARLSFYMLLLAGLIGSALYVVDRSLFG